MSCRCGLGQIDVEPLAQAVIASGWSPGFRPELTIQNPDIPGQTTQLSGYLYATDAFAAQLAYLLGGSVVKGPLPNGYASDLLPSGAPVPLTDYISVDGQQILPGNLFQTGNALSFYGDLCMAEQYLVNSIPGGEFGPQCASYAATTPNPLITMSPTGTAPQAGVVATTAPAATGTTPAATNVTTPTAVSVATPVTMAPAPSQVVTSTPGANVGTVGTTATPTTTATTCFNPLSTLLGSDTCLGPLGLYEWIGIGVLALMLLGGSK
jgi:hypothetical protein